MRAILKGAGSRKLNAKLAPVSASDATRAWNNFRSRGKLATQLICLSEQFYLCGYSEIDLANHTPILGADGTEIARSLGIHLEHVEPKSSNPGRTFDHSNLIACAIDDASARGLLRLEVFGGHAKLRWHSQYFISPLMPNCRDYFFFESSTGKVVPRKNMVRRDQAKARLTIYKLNLNSPVLMLWRKTWLMETESIINSLLDNPDALRHFCSNELLPLNGRLRPFHSAQRQLFGRLGEEICMQHSPPL